jgi:hypothetical protein
MGSKKRSAQRRAAETQQGQTRLESILAAQEADRASARERALLGEIGQQAGVEYERGISDFQQATGTPFRVSGGPFRLGRSAEFDAETTGTPAAVTRLQELIRQQALPEQQRAAAQGRIALQQAGVRGPEAALMMQRQQNRMQTDLANRAEQVALQQALADRGVRQQFAAQRGMQEAQQARAERMSEIEQARADRAAQQEFARQRAINAQEKAFAKGVTAEGRPQFDAAEQAKSFDTFKSLQRGKGKSTKDKLKQLTFGKFF